MPLRTYIAIIILVGSAVFAYTFKSKLDLNGDNANYYIYATSLATGHGYADISQIDERPTNAFPPGYPLLMAGVRVFTDSIVAQKILNGLFLILSGLLMFAVVSGVFSDRNMGLLAALTALVNYKVLGFASIMMSEMSYLMLSLLAIYLALRLWNSGATKDIPWWKNVYFYLLIVVSGYAFMIRTQGVALPVAMVFFMLFERKWIPAVVYAAGVYITSLPWTLRNIAVGLGGNRYAQQVFATNMWRPEDGYLSGGELVMRGLKTLEMIITKAIPETVMPYLRVDYQAASSLGEWLAGLVLIAVMVYGILQCKRIAPLLLAYLVASIGLICLWSAPSQSRYLTTLLPLMEVALVVGIYYIMKHLLGKLHVHKAVNPLWLLIVVVLAAAPRIKEQRMMARANFTPNYINFFQLGQYTKNKLPKDAVVCSRKPSLFYMYSKGYVCSYVFSLEAREVLQGLLNSQATHVVLDQLGYSSTGRYLWPVVQKYPNLFPIVLQLQNPDTYLLKFEREQAQTLLNNEEVD